MILSAAIFDLNGTFLSDEDEYGKAFTKVLSQFGITNIPEVPHIAGIGVAENWPNLLEKYGIKTDKSIELLAKETQDAYEAMIDEVTLADGVLEFIADLKRTGVYVALATSNGWSMVDKIVEKFKLEGFFDVISTGEEVEHKKPDPELFNLTAEKLGVDAKECLIFEDAEAGIVAAHEAGMKVVAISRIGGEEDLEDADMTISSFTEMTPEVILQI
jgi:beta-phosphoglucomutase